MPEARCFELKNRLFLHYWKTLKTVLLEGRVFRDWNDEPWLISPYRLPRKALSDLWTDLALNLERKTCCNHAIHVGLSVQVLSTLGFLATGTFQREMSDSSGISQLSFSGIKPQVIEAILQVLFTRYISFPFTTDGQAHVKAVAVNFKLI